MSHTRIIARREFTTTVRRGSYILATLGTPLLLLIIAGITTIPSMVALKREMAERDHLEVVDEAGLLTPEVLAASQEDEAAGGDVLDELMSRVVERRKLAVKARIELFPSEAAAVAALEAGRIQAFYVIPRDYLATGKLQHRSARSRKLWDPTGGGGPLRSLLVEGLLAGKVDAARRARARQPIVGVEALVLRPGGQFVPEHAQYELSRIVVPAGFAFTLMLSIFIASGYLIQGLAEEKSTRVIEVLLSSVTPGELIAGKLIGLGGAGLLQLAVWTGAATVPMLVAGWFVVPLGMVLLALVYYLVGFLFYGSIMAGLGCVTGGTQESQQFASVGSVVAVVPMLFSPLILEAPNGVLARVLSYVPLTCPITMIMRAGTGTLAWWEVPLSVLVMVVSIYGTLRVAARLFRVGLLLHGQRPTLGELVAFLKQA